MPTSTSRWRWLVVSASAALLPVGCGAGLQAGSSVDSTPLAGLLGNPAPDFNVKPVRGSRVPVSLRALRGKVVLIDFWGTYCGPCRQTFPKLQALNAAYAGSGLHIIGISEDEAEDKDKIPTFADTYGAKFTIAWDEDKSIAHQYKPETMPCSYVIDKRGVVRYAHVGYRAGDEVAIEKEVARLLAQD